jgi:hypothetical protein
MAHLVVGNAASVSRAVEERENLVVAEASNMSIEVEQRMVRLQSSKVAKLVLQRIWLFCVQLAFELRRLLLVDRPQYWLAYPFSAVP